MPYLEDLAKMIAQARARQGGQGQGGQVGQTFQPPMYQQRGGTPQQQAAGNRKLGIQSFWTDSKMGQGDPSLENFLTNAMGSTFGKVKGVYDIGKMIYGLL